VREILAAAFVLIRVTIAVLTYTAAGPHSKVIIPLFNKVYSVSRI